MALPPESVRKLLESPHAIERRRGLTEVASRRLRELLPQVQEMAHSDRENDVRAMAQKTSQLVALELLLEAPPAPAPDPAEFLRALDDPAPAVRRYAAAALCHRRVRDQTARLLELGTTETDPGVLEALAEGYPDLADGGSYSEIVALLVARLVPHPGGPVRARAVQALDRLDARETAPLVIAATIDAELKVREAAMRALKRWGPATVLGAARSMLLAVDPVQREAAVHAATQLLDPGAVTVLTRAAFDGDEGIRARARAGLERLAAAGIGPASEVLGRLVEYGDAEVAPPAPRADGESEWDPDPARRIAAINQVVESERRDRSVWLLARLEMEPDPFVQGALIMALGHFRLEEAVPLLLTFLRSTDGRLRANAVEVLGRISDPDRRRILVPFLADPNNRVRANAVVACADLAGVEIEPILQEMLASDDVWMRKSALFAIRSLKDPDLEIRLVGYRVVGLAGEGIPDPKRGR